MDMPNEDEQNKERSKVSLRIGEVQVELEGTYDSIKKLMDKELFDFAKSLEGTTKQLPSSTETAPKLTPKTPEITPKEKTVPPPSKPSTTPETPAKKSRLFTIAKKTEKTNKRKIGWKPLAIALVMVCIMLSAGLVGVIAVYLPMVSNLDSQIAEKDTELAALSSQVSSLNTQVLSLRTNLAQNESYIANLEEGIDVLNSRLEGYFNIISLNVSTYLFEAGTLQFTQEANSSTITFQNVLDYAGYVIVDTLSSSNTTYVQLLYSSYGVNYDHNVTVATSGVAYFPVLPGAVEIVVGNTEPTGSDSVDMSVVAIYYY
jgi:cell division protein FtsB